MALLSVPPRHQIAGFGGLLGCVQGHGIHLAANSVAQREPGDTAFFWDELAGHAIWYSGLYFVVGALLMGQAVRSAPGLLRLVLAVAVGITFATNALGGHAVPLAVVPARCSPCSPCAAAKGSAWTCSWPHWRLC